MIALAVFASGCARHNDWRHAVIDPLPVFPGIDKAPARTHLVDRFLPPGISARSLLFMVATDPGHQQRPKRPPATGKQVWQPFTNAENRGVELVDRGGRPSARQQTTTDHRDRGPYEPRDTERA